MTRNGRSEEALEGQGYVSSSFIRFYVIRKISVGRLCSLDGLPIESEGCEHVLLKIKQTAASVFTVDRG